MAFTAADTCCRAPFCCKFCVVPCLYVTKISSAQFGLMTRQWTSKVRCSKSPVCALLNLCTLHCTQLDILPPVLAPALFNAELSKSNEFQHDIRDQLALLAGLQGHPLPLLVPSHVSASFCHVLKFLRLNAVLQIQISQAPGPRLQLNKKQGAVPQLLTVPLVCLM